MFQIVFQSIWLCYLNVVYTFPLDYELQLVHAVGGIQKTIIPGEDSYEWINLLTSKLEKALLIICFRQEKNSLELVVYMVSSL